MKNKLRDRMIKQFSTGLSQNIVICLACVAGGIVWARDLSFGGGAVFQEKGSRNEAVENSQGHVLHYHELRSRISYF